MEKYFQPEIETMPVEQIQTLQSERLVCQVKYVYDNVKFYRETWYSPNVHFIVAWFITQTSHIKNGTCSLKNQYFSS